MKIDKLFLLIIALIATSCVGKVEPSDSDSITIEASKPQISVEEGESVTIKVKNWSDNISDQAEIYYTYAGEQTIVEGGVFTATEAGTYTFSARIDGEECDESVTITAYTADQLSDTFFRRHLVMKFTGTWCTNCPAMGDIITAIEHEMPFEIVEMAIHSNDELKIDEGEKIVADQNYIFLPTVVVDLDLENEITKTAKDLITSAISSSTTSNPTVAGLRIKSSVSGGKISIETGVTTSVAGDYKLAIAVVGDNYHYAQKGASSSNYRQNKVLRLYATDCYGDAITLTPNEESIFNYEVAEPTDVPGDMRIIAYLLSKQSDGTYLTNNSTECEVGDEINYIYELNL